MGESQRRKRYYLAEGVKLVKSHCTNCGKEMDGASGFSHDEKPKSGSIGICIACFHIMAYDEALKLRELNDQEIQDVAGDENILAALKALGRAKIEYEALNPGKKWSEKAR